ncbi:MAG: 30S ribosomal protein S6 [Balneolaceae bacterium]
MKKDFFEMTTILNPVLEEDKFPEMVKFITDLIEKNDGEIVEVEEWGVKKLAYDIDKKGSGYFVNLYFNAPGSAIEVVERNMRINDDILRYLTLKYDSKMKRHYDLRKKGELPVFIEPDTEEDNEDDN